MIKKFVTKKSARFIVAIVFGLSLFALAQTSPAAGAPAAASTPDSPSTAAATVAKARANATKIGTIDIQSAIAASNEGRRDLEALNKKFEPKQNELKGLADEIDGLKKQLSAQQDKLNEESRDKLVKQIEAKQKGLDRAAQDAQEDFQNQQGEIVNRIMAKLGPIITKYVVDNGYGLLLDTSQATSFPRGPVIMSGPALDITQPVVEAYNSQSGVAAPAAGSVAPKPAKPATSPASKPATTKPPASAPPKQ